LKIHRIVYFLRCGLAPSIILTTLTTFFSCTALASDPAALQSLQIVTNINQFRRLPSEDYLRKCSFRLTGIATLVDTNRDLLVLQDGTGALAVNFKLTNPDVKPGQRICLDGVSGSPYVENFPDYPYRPAGWDIQSSFDAPKNWGDYNLTRMRGYLHPPVTGDYTFWIASDNSSELWLSPNADPAEARRIAMVKQGDWVNPYEWTRYPSQRSEIIHLRAGQTYYIEAFQEQITLAENLSVAWQGPGIHQSVIAGRYLTPWVGNPDQKRFAETNGALREYWTNYFAGSLSGITGPRHFESVLTAEGVHLTVFGNGAMPEPDKIQLDQPLGSEENYRWVEVEGNVTFAAGGGNSAVLVMNGGQAQIRISHYDAARIRQFKDCRVRVFGVCEGVYNSSGALMPGLIWTPAESDVHVVEPAKTELNGFSKSSPYPNNRPADTNVWKGFYSTFYTARGVVTFKGRVFDKNCLFVQDENHGFFVTQPESPIRSKFEVGQLVELGGYLVPGKYSLSLQPLIVTTLGWGIMPEPGIGPTDGPVAENRDNQWTEVEGVVHAVSPNGVLKMVGKKGSVSIWIGDTSTNILNHYVDATLKIRGVMTLSTFDTPLLLVPSRDFVEVEESPPGNPSGIPLHPIASLKDFNPGSQWVHRIKVEGVATYRNNELSFVQDKSGGVCVQIPAHTTIRVGEQVTVLGFPETRDACPMLIDARLFQTGVASPLNPIALDSGKFAAGKYDGTLVQLRASLLAQKNNAGGQTLELQDGQRILAAVLTINQGKLPSLAVGSRLQVTGIYMANPGNSPAIQHIAVDNLSENSMQIWLRSPSDIKLLAGPPWWTWEKIVALVSALFIVLMGTLLWVYLLRGRLERQQAMQRAFSRQILQSQENERRRIASNLHDSLGQNLLVIKNQTRLAMQPADESVLRQRLNEISGVVLRSLDEVRQITHDLRPYQLDRLGLTQAIRAIVNRVSENSQILFASHIDNIDGVFDKESEIHVYRIVQEAINNIIKHSGANEAAVVIKKSVAGVSLSIRDNGHGFENYPADGANSHDHGFGLSGMRERAQILNGRLIVDSRAGQGVNLAFEIPTPVSTNGTRN
jgi:signal transduction histidine kinase